MIQSRDVCVSTMNRDLNASTRRALRLMRDTRTPDDDEEKRKCARTLTTTRTQKERVKSVRVVPLETKACPHRKDKRKENEDLQRKD